MKKLFGQFLVERGVIDSDQLLNALILQQKDMPLIQEVVSGLNLLSSSQILDALSYQNKNDKSFRSACVDLEFWKPEWDEKVQKELTAQRKPLGWIIRKEFNIPTEKLITELDEFVALFSDESPESNIQSQDATPSLEAAPAPETAPEPVVEPAPEESAPETSADEDQVLSLSQSSNAPSIFDDLEFKDIDTEVFMEYAEMLNDDKKSELELAILGWGKLSPTVDTDRDALNTALRDFYREYHTIKGSVRFIGGVLTERLVHKAEDYLSVVMNNIERITDEQYKIFPGLNLEVIDLVWHLCSIIADTGQESGILGQEEAKKQIEAVYSNIHEAHTKLSDQFKDIDLDEVADAF